MLRVFGTSKTVWGIGALMVALGAGPQIAEAIGGALAGGEGDGEGGGEGGGDGGEGGEGGEGSGSEDLGPVNLGPGAISELLQREGY